MFVWLNIWGVTSTDGSVSIRVICNGHELWKEKVVVFIFYLIKYNLSYQMKTLFSVFLKYFFDLHLVMILGK